MAKLYFKEFLFRLGFNANHLTLFLIYIMEKDLYHTYILKIVLQKISDIFKSSFYFQNHFVHTVILK